MRAQSRLYWLCEALRGHAWQLAAVLALSVIATSLSLLQPYLTKVLIDDGLVMRRAHVIATICAVMVGFGIGAAALQAVTLRIHTRLSGRVLFGLRTRVFAHLLTLSPDWHARNSLGDTLSRLDGDIGEVQRFAVDTLLTAVNALFAVSVSFAVMMSMDVRLALLVVLIVPGQLVCLHLVRRRLVERGRSVRQSAAKIAGFLYDALAAVKFIQTANAQARQERRLAAMGEDYLDEVVRLKVAGMASVSIPNYVTTLTMASVFVVGGFELASGASSIGTLIALTTYVTRATAPLTALLGLYVSSRRIQVNLERVQALLDARAVVTSPTRPRALPLSGTGAIEFDNVCFSYPAGGGPVLEGASLVVIGGGKVAIVGKSGAGKSTVADLLLRHYDPHAGTIRLDGVDLRDLDLAQLRRAVAVVAQEPTIVAGSIAENIAFCAPETSPKAIAEAARWAGIHEDIEALPQSYRTVLNTRGDTLSGGQRQRIALARVFLQRPRLLILDEATSAVDTNVATALADTIDRLFGDVTRIVISHRAEPLRNADSVYAVEHARFRALPLSTVSLVAVPRNDLRPYGVQRVG